MTGRTAAASLVLLALAPLACEQTAESAGEITLAISYAGAGSGLGGAEPAGVIILRAGGEERQLSFSDPMDEMAGSFRTMGLTLTPIADAGPPSGWWSTFSIHDGIPCDPAAGPVEITVRLSSFVPAPPAGGLASPFAPREQSVTVPCQAGWATGGAVSFDDLANPHEVGELRVRVVLADPPPGATEGTAVIKVRPATLEAGSDGYAPFESVPLAREGDRLVGAWTSLCVGDWTRRAFVDLGALTVPGLDEAAVWSRWPPPGRASGDVACAVGQVREVEIVLSPRR